MEFCGTFSILHNKTVFSPLIYNMRRVKVILLLFALLATCPSSYGQRMKQNTEVLRQMLRFGEKHAGLIPDTDTMNVYTRSTLNIVKRNMILACVPTMFYVVRDGKRKYLDESYSRVAFSKGGPQPHRNLHISTIYHGHQTLPVMVKYLTPRIYDEQLFKDGILSPINYHNRHFYRYKMHRNGDGTSLIIIRSRYRNTQLVRKGYVTVDDSTGQVHEFSFEGEYDMIHSVLKGNMRTTGDIMIPENCDVQAKFSFLGSKVLAHYSAFYDLPTTFPDSIIENSDRQAMASIRPVPLSEEEAKILHDYDSVRHAEAVSDMEEARKDSISGVKPKKNWAKHVFWDVIGDNLLNRIKANLGDENQGSVRISPLFNPLYFGYSKRKGFYYKFDMRGNYNFTDNSGIFTRVKMGYSFKQNQLFFTIPLQWDFNKRRNGYVRAEFGNGNRITNSRVLENVKRAASVDSINWDAMNLDYFKDTKFRVEAGYDVIARTLGVQVGVMSHRRTAVHKQGFIDAGRPTTYKSFAPFLQLQYRPLTDDEPLVLTSQYEHGMKALGGSISYDRFEFDGQYIHDMTRMRSWQLRAGFGFYTSKGHNDYFLDYRNFQEDYIPSGWGDKWTGEFELLNSNWYNASDYYIRANATYESPLLFLSHCPLIGQIMEKERIYISALAVRRLFPYVEAGYGFVNRVFSMGVFTGLSPLGFEGVGLKFGFELFNDY